MDQLTGGSSGKGPSPALIRSRSRPADRNATRRTASTGADIRTSGSARNKPARSLSLSLISTAKGAQAASIANQKACGVEVGPCGLLGSQTPRPERAFPTPAAYPRESWSGERRARRRMSTVAVAVSTVAGKMRGKCRGTVSWA